jgi:hypothetical protein
MEHRPMRMVLKVGGESALAVVMGAASDGAITASEGIRGRHGAPTASAGTSRLLPRLHPWPKRKMAMKRRKSLKRRRT